MAEHYSKVYSQLDIHEVIGHSATMKAELMRILSGTDKQIDDYDYHPLKSKYQNIILIFTPQGEIVDYISVPSK